MNIIIECIGSVHSEIYDDGMRLPLSRLIYFQVVSDKMTLSGKLTSGTLDLSFTAAEKEVREFITRQLIERD